MKRLIFVDVDGTLKNSDGEITKKTKYVLTKLKKMGIEIIITTGTPRYYALNTQLMSNASRYVISSNGAEVYDSLEGNVIFSNYINSKDILKIYKIANKNKAKFIMTIDNIEIVTDTPKNENQIKLNESLKECLNKVNVKQLYIKTRDENIAHKIYKKISKIKGIKIVNESPYFRTGIIEEKGIWFTIVNKNVSKGNAIRELCKHLDVDLEYTYGFGNDYNDLEMFDTVNYSIAMENAYEGLDKKAKLIAKSNNEDGVAKFLEKLFLEDKEG